MKALLCACIYLCISAQAYSQISVFYSKNGTIKYSLGGDAEERRQSTLKSCQDQGGSSCQEASMVLRPYSTDMRFTCWAIVTGTDKAGNKVVVYDHFRQTVDEAISSCRSDLVNVKGAEPGSISVAYSGCIPPPAAAKQSAAATAEWSAWKQAPCYKGLQYRVKGVEVFDLNRQYHYYFEVRNHYLKDISFLFNLLDAGGQVRFGDRHDVRKGQTVSFVHKMTSNYISSFEVLQMRGAHETQDQPCDDATGSAPAEQTDNVDWHRDIKEMALLLYQGEQQMVGNSPDKASQLKNLDQQITAIEKRFKQKYGNRKDLNDKIVNDYMMSELQKLKKSSGGAGASSANTPAPTTSGDPTRNLPVVTMQTTFAEDVKICVDILCKVTEAGKSERREDVVRANAVFDHLRKQYEALAKKYPDQANQKRFESAMSAETKGRGCPEIH